MKIKLFRDIKAVSSNGSQFTNKLCLFKRKITEDFKAKSREERTVELPLGQIQITDKNLDAFKKSKPHIVGELKHWLNTI